jgi:ATP/maltotriose-dependent transcriptional regulator MalT
LSLAAIILANEGNLVRAAELLGLAFTHPVGVSRWMEQWELLSRLQTYLEQALGREDYLAAWERGSRLDLEQTGTQVFKELPSELNRPVSQAKQPLIEPISNRELEVLLLIGAGLTNHEIAEQLFISVSTVKKHINHIYGKLGVKNRTSAVASARELQILQ